MKKPDIKLPIATRLIVSFLLIIFMTSIIFMLVGIRMINDRIVNETQEKVRNDLNSARVIYNNQQNRISDVVRLTANRSLLTDAILKHDLQSIASELS
ncbi:MAG: hypothetical protein WCF08_04230, partial [Anaerolineaceae bacterium]